MSQVIFDGKYLSTQVNKANYNYIYNIIKDCNYFDYDKDLSIVHLPPTRKVARRLFRLGCKFDDSSKHFIEGFGFEDMVFDDRLFPFQKEGVKLLLREGNQLLADPMGLGKTVQALSYLNAVGNNALPCLIITPATLKETWRNFIEDWTPFKPIVVNGTRLQDGIDLHITNCILIINYDILAEEDKELKRKEEERVNLLKAKGYHATYNPQKVRGWCDILSEISWKTIIADEIQYISGTSSIRSRAVSQICQASDCKKIFLSGTPYETKTSQFYLALHLLRPDLFPNEYNFKMRYCDPRKNKYGWKFEGLSNADELRDKLSQFMIRRKKEEVLSQLPPKLRSVVYLDVSEDERSLYDSSERDFVSDLMKGKSKDNMLAHISKMRGYACRAKEKSVIRWIEEYLKIHGGKLVVFVHHKFMYDILMKKFGKKCVGINGSVPSNKRQSIVDKFQENDKIKLFIGEIKSCGAGITLTSSDTVCFVEFGQTCVQHEQAEDRVHRIGQTADKVFAFYLVMSDSIEESFMSTLNKRNKDMKLLMDNKEKDVMFSHTEEDWRDMVLKDFSIKKRKYRTVK
jgi:SWI/SNF-related matrix-associated actin-dependent regulator 1 of chromatin subfamily A